MAAESDSIEVAIDDVRAFEIHWLASVDSLYRPSSRERMGRFTCSNGLLAIMECSSRHPLCVSFAIPPHASLKRTIQENLKAAQEELTTTLITLITSPAPYPLPGRPIRSVVAQCLLALYARGETKTLYDTVQAFIKVAADQKSTVLADVHRMYVHSAFT